MSPERIEPRPPYPPLPEWKWPEPGQQTWQPSNGGRYVFPGCIGAASCACACSVGVRTVGTGVYGCDCPGHDARRARLASRAQ